MSQAKFDLILVQINCLREPQWDREANFHRSIPKMPVAIVG